MRKPNHIRAAAILLCSAALAACADAGADRVDELVHSALQRDRHVSSGAALYAEHCAACHGPKGFGNAAQLIPALAGQRQAYLIQQLARFTELERESDTMHLVVARPELEDPQAWADIAAYLNALPPARFAQAGDGHGVNLGEAIFREQCASCHEDDARGDDEGFVPSLRNQHYSYLLRQMRAIAAWHRFDADEDLVRFLDSLETEELTAVADYLARQHGPTRDRSRLHTDGTTGD